MMLFSYFSGTLSHTHTAHYAHITLLANPENI